MIVFRGLDKSGFQHNTVQHIRGLISNSAAEGGY